MQQLNDLLEPIEIGGLTLKNRVFLAPMSGISDVPFRAIAWRFGAGLVLSEMVASEALAAGNGEMARKAERGDLALHAVQIAGRDPAWMAYAAKLAVAGGAALIDINMGCPAKRVTNGACGAALMRDLDLASEVIAAVIAAVPVPVTLKMRLGWDRSMFNAPELAGRAEALGVRMITVHGRTRDQFYDGRADWKAVARVRQATSLPLVVNGDISNLADARAALAQSGADAVMVGRAACGAPWLPGAIAAGWPDGRRPDGLPKLVLGHYEAILRHYREALGIRHARKHLGWYFDRWANQCGPDVRRAMLTATDANEVRNLISEAFAADTRACDPEKWERAA